MMAAEERRAELADALAGEHVDQIDYIRSTTLLLGLLQTAYGVLTFVFGMQLWAATDAYAMLRAAPLSPHSVGATFVVLGVGVLAFGNTRHYLALAVILSMSALISSTAAVMFTWGAFSSPHTADSAVLGLFTAIIALLYLNRSWLAWQTSRRR